MAVVRMSDEYPNGGTSKPVVHRISSDPGLATPEPKANEPVKMVPVVSSKGSIKKKTFGQKLRETFIAADMSNVGDYIMRDILVPTIKDVIVNSVRNAISIAVYGEPDRSSYRRRSSGYFGGSVRDYGYDYDNSYSSYSSYYGDYRRRRSPDPAPVAPYMGNSGSLEIWIPYYPEAIDVLRCLRDGLSSHPSVTLSNLYELSGMSDMITPECNSRGWTDLSAAYVKQEGEAGVIVLPPTCYLNEG